MLKYGVPSDKIGGVFYILSIFCLLIIQHNLFLGVVKFDSEFHLISYAHGISFSCEFMSKRKTV